MNALFSKVIVPRCWPDGSSESQVRSPVLLRNWSQTEPSRPMRAAATGSAKNIERE
jgi:hypothetical protein